MKSVDELQLHETIYDAGFKIIRVPNGWIYKSLKASDTGCFVPGIKIHPKQKARLDKILKKFSTD